VKLSYFSRQLKLNHTFAVANSSKSFAENTFVYIEFENEIGYGEVAPSYFYHENTATINQVLETVGPLLQHSRLSVQSIMSEVGKKVSGNYAARAGIEMALMDLAAKKESKSVREFLGINKNRSLVTSFTIGIDNLNIIKEKVLDAREFPILKIKLGTNQDFEIVEAIRSITDKPLRIDANEGWSREEAVEKINWLETQNVEFVEQPLPADDIQNTAWIRERVNVPVFADESVKSSRDIEKLASAFDGINIKLMKCGGINEALKMVDEARRCNLSTMLGCFIESSLGITAAANIASLFDFVDLDGALLLKDDPFIGVSIAQGQMTLPDKPGIGAEPVEMN